jgi:hypothetical protein
MSSRPANASPAGPPWPRRLPVLQGTRLRLRPPTPTDAPALMAIYGDPEVMRFAGDPPFADRAAAHRMLAMRAPPVPRARVAGVGRPDEGGSSTCRHLRPAWLRSGRKERRDGCVAGSPRASLHLLWALHGALTGVDWSQVAREDRTLLLLALGHHERHAEVT